MTDATPMLACGATPAASVAEETGFPCSSARNCLKRKLAAKFEMDKMTDATPMPAYGTTPMTPVTEEAGFPCSSARGRSRSTTPRADDEAGRGRRRSRSRSRERDDPKPRSRSRDRGAAVPTSSSTSAPPAAVTELAPVCRPVTLLRASVNDCILQCLEGQSFFRKDALKSLMGEAEEGEVWEYTEENVAAATPILEEVRDQWARVVETCKFIDSYTQAVEEDMKRSGHKDRRDIDRLFLSAIMRFTLRVADAKIPLELLPITRPVHAAVNVLLDDFNEVVKKLCDE